MADFSDPDNPDMAVPDCTLTWQSELPEAVIALAVSPKEQLVAVGTVEDEICLLSMADGEVKFRLAGHAGGTNGVQFLSGNTLVSVGEDGKARVWNIGRQTCTHELAIDAVEPDTSPSGFTVSHLTVSPARDSFACAAGKTVVQFTMSTAQTQQTAAGGTAAGAAGEPARRVFPPLVYTVESLRFDRRGNLLAAYYGGVTYWDLSRSEEELQALDLPYSGACLSADATPRGDWIVAGCHDASTHIYHFKQKGAQGVEVEEMNCGGYESKVTLVDFDRQGRFMASAGGERCIVWDFSKTPAGSVPTLLLGHRKVISCQGWQPDGELLATGSKDGRVFVFDVSYAMPAGRQGGPNMCLPGAMADQLGEEVCQLVWLSEGRLAVGYVTGFVRLWELPLADSSEEEEAQQAVQGEGREPTQAQ